MWLGATVLGGTDIKHFHRLRKFYWTILETSTQEPVQEGVHLSCHQSANFSVPRPWSWGVHTHLSNPVFLKLVTTVYPPLSSSLSNNLEYAHPKTAFTGMGCIRFPDHPVSSYFPLHQGDVFASGSHSYSQVSTPMRERSSLLFPCLIRLLA